VREKSELRWGPEVYSDGQPDFGKIAEKVFAKEEDYRFALSLTLPGTKAEMVKLVRKVGGWIVLEIPLLFETGWFDLIDCVICVTSTDDLRVARNLSRGWREDEIALRERFMIGSSKKQALSDMVLCNVGSMEAWEARARELGELMLRMSTVHELATFCRDREEAARTASALVENGLAAGASVMEAGCTYRWEGDVNDLQVLNFRCLTTEKNLRRAMECVRQNNSCEPPVITVREVLRSDFSTLKWVVENCD
jgi:dephospho-CoA kinase